MVTLTSETLYFEAYFETKLQADFDKSDQVFEQPEEELIYFIEQQHQKSEYIEEELVTLKSTTYCLSETTEVIDEILVWLPSQLFSAKITASSDENFDQLSMNNSCEGFKIRT